MRISNTDMPDNSTKLREAKWTGLQGEAGESTLARLPHPLSQWTDPQVEGHQGHGRPLQHHPPGATTEFADASIQQQPNTHSSPAPRPTHQEGHILGHEKHRNKFKK